jgi:hypothetical protein
MRFSAAATTARFKGSEPYLPTVSSSMASSTTLSRAESVRARLRRSNMSKAEALPSCTRPFQERTGRSISASRPPTTMRAFGPITLDKHTLDSLIRRLPDAAHLELLIGQLREGMITITPWGDFARLHPQTPLACTEATRLSCHPPHNASGTSQHRQQQGEQGSGTPALPAESPPSPLLSCQGMMRSRPHCLNAFGWSAFQ